MEKPLLESNWRPVCKSSTQHSAVRLPAASHVSHTQNLQPGDPRTHTPLWRRRGRTSTYGTFFARCQQFFIVRRRALCSRGPRIERRVGSIAMASALAAFSIDRILGLELQRPGNGLKLHRPWAEIGSEKESRGNVTCSPQQQQQQQQQHPQQMNSPRPTSNWYIGRRPRTAFTNSQVNVLETVFQVNCYPGIQLREQLAGRLDLDEDRIQIWFQNRRAKLRRSLRETRLRRVQTAVADVGVGGRVKAERDPVVEKEEERCR
ncbi:homeobox expressed in ES cells 1 [Gasterosteus aculeatus]